MAASNDEVDLEEFSHCIVCISAYDELERKPKFLSCFHTFCLSCMKSFTRKLIGSIPCPKCRKETPCAIGQEGDLSTNFYALKFMNTVSLPPSVKSLVVDDRWCFPCKKKATVSCMMGHKPKVVIMESKPTSFLVELQQSMDDEENEINLTAEQWKQFKRDVKKVYETLSRGLRGLQDMEEEIGYSIEQMSDLKEGIRVIPEDATASSLAEEMEDIANSKMDVQRDFESNVRKSSLPTDELVSAMEVLLYAFGVGDKELSREEKETLKRLKAAVSGNRIDPGSGDVVSDFGVTITFFHRWGTKIGTVLIKPDANIFRNLHLGAFNRFDDEYPFFQIQMLYATKILNADAASNVLLSGMEPIIKDMLLNTEFLSEEQYWDNGDQFSASEMEVKLVEFPQAADSLDRFKLGFFLNRWSHRDPGILNQSLRSIPFGRLIEGWNVIESMSALSQDERNCVKVEIDYRYGLLDLPQEEESWD